MHCWRVNRADEPPTTCPYLVHNSHIAWFSCSGSCAFCQCACSRALRPWVRINLRKVTTRAMFFPRKKHVKSNDVIHTLTNIVADNIPCQSTLFEVPYSSQEGEYMIFKYMFTWLEAGFKLKPCMHAKKKVHSRHQVPPAEHAEPHPSTAPSYIGVVTS